MENSDQEKNKQFLIDFQVKTAGIAAERVLKLLGLTDNLFILSQKPEDIEKNNTAYEKVLQNVLEIFIECNVGLTNYSFVWSSLKSIITALEQHMNNHNTNMQKEILARVIEVKNPLDGKYDSNYANHNDIIQTVLKLREQQGNVPGAEDYFTIIKEPVPSPMTREEINNK